ncbi:MAG: hypothetical protein ACON5D_04050 [Rubripirellula sp.]
MNRDSLKNLLTRQVAGLLAGWLDEKLASVQETWWEHLVRGNLTNMQKGQLDQKRTARQSCLSLDFAGVLRVLTRNNSTLSHRFNYPEQQTDVCLKILQYARNELAHDSLDSDLSPEEQSVYLWAAYTLLEILEIDASSLPVHIPLGGSGGGNGSPSSSLSEDDAIALRVQIAQLESSNDLLTRNLTDLRQDLNHKNAVLEEYSKSFDAKLQEELDAKMAEPAVQLEIQKRIEHQEALSQQMLEHELEVQQALAQQQLEHELEVQQALHERHLEESVQAGSPGNFVEPAGREGENAPTDNVLLSVHNFNILEPGEPVVSEISSQAGHPIMATLLHYPVTGPGGLQFELCLSLVDDNDDLDEVAEIGSVYCSSRSSSPEIWDQIVSRLRMGIYFEEGHGAWMNLPAAVPKAAPGRCTRRQLPLSELNQRVATNVPDALALAGTSQVGTRFDLLGDDRKGVANKLCVVFDQEKLLVPVAAYILTTLCALHQDGFGASH